jgi:predicted DNA-binding transcriptional regulator YafY
VHRLVERLTWIGKLVRLHEKAWQDRTVKRLTRIVSMALLLSARRRLRAEELASHFGVSLRTVYRDLSSLEEAGFPVVGTAGDGYTIPAAAQLRPLGFEPEEAEALVMAARLLGASSASDSLATHLQSALAKLEAGLPPESVRRLRDHRRAVILPGGDQASAGPLGVLLEAIHDRRVVHIHYDGLARGEVTERDIEPIGLVRLGAWWLVTAYCRLREDLRAFRSDRIRAAAPRTEMFTPREGMTLEDVVARERAKGEERGGRRARD